MPSYLPIKTQVLLHSWTNRYQHLTNFIRWKFPIQIVPRIGKGFVTFVWWGHLKWQVADHIARGGILQHDGLIAALFCEADTIPMRHWLHFWNLTESWLSADLGILSSHCAVPTAAEMRRDWEHTQKPWRATKEVCANHLPLVSQPCKRLWRNIWIYLSSCCSHRWNICLL